MTTHSSILAWRIPVDRGACGLQSIGLQRVTYDWESNTHTHTHTHTHTPLSKTIALQLNSLSTFCFLCLENASFFTIQLIPNQPNCQLPREVFSDPAGRAVSLSYSHSTHIFASALITVCGQRFLWFLLKYMFQPLLCKLPKATCLISVEHSGQGRKVKKKNHEKRKRVTEGRRARKGKRKV